jgi:hypothetical protein
MLTLFGLVSIVAGGFYAYRALTEMVDAIYDNTRSAPQAFLNFVLPLGAAALNVTFFATGVSLLACVWI